MGGGDVEPKNPLFKPLVATSLAVALGVSVATATDPTITAESSADNTSANAFELTWTSEDGVMKPNFTNTASNTSIVTTSGNFSFYLENKDATKSISFTNDGDFSNGYKAQVYGYNTLTINNQGNIIQMGDGGGTLGVGGGDGTTVTLDFSSLAQTNQYSLKGSLFIGSWDSGKVDATFGGKGLSGMIRVGGGTGNTITFKENAEVGKFWFHKGTTTITFEKNATIRAGDSGSGIIYTGNSYTTIGNGTGGQTFVFNGTNNIIENTSGGPAIDITANADASNLNNTYDRLIFKKGVNTITGKIQSQINSNAKTNNSGKNFIVFENTTTKNTITGDIYSAFGYNTIVFAGASNSISTIDNLATTATNKLIGDISSKGLNSGEDGKLINNLVYFKEDGCLQGNISADSNPTGEINYARNMIVFEKKGYIKGDITGSGVNEWINRNYLVFGGEAKIEGMINKANNNILLSSTNSNLTITELVYGNTKIWGSSQDMSVLDTLDYNSDTTYKTAVATFFDNNPSDDTLVGTLNLKKGITDEGVYGVNIRVDTLNIDTNTDDPNNTFSIKSSNTWGSTFVIKTSGLIKGNIITEKVNTNISLVGDSTTLTLQGQSNQISTLTAKSGATTGDTLIIDSTNNANTTTINSIANGDSLIVNFKGQGENKGATLNLKSTPALKQVIIDSNSTNNTLDLTQTSRTTINTKIAISDNQQLAINLDNTELALANSSGLETTGGSSTINVSNTGTLSGGDIVATSLNLNGSSANATLKSANTTFANLVAEGGTLTLGEGSTNATINSTNSTFNATFAGNSAQTLAINGGKNTITTLALNAQANTLSIGEGNTTITNTITSDTGNTLNLQIGNNSKSASLTLLNTIKTDNTGSGTAGVVNVVFAGTSTPSTLTLNGDNNILTSVDATNAGTLITNDSNLTITALTGNNLTAGFSGNNASRIAISGANGGTKTITLADVVLNNNAKGTLDLSLLTNTTITNNVSVGANQSLAIALGGTSSALNLSGGLSGNATINAGATDSNQINISGNSNSLTNLNFGGTNNTLAGSSIALSNLNLNGTGANTTTLTASNVAINTLKANATTSNKLILDATNNTNGVSASINSIGSTTRGVGDFDIALNSGDNTTTLSLNGNTINSLDIQGENNNLVGNAKITSLTSANGGTLNINGGNVEVTSAITPTSSHNMSLALNSGAELSAKQGLNSTSANINLTLSNSTLSLGATSTITSLSGNGGVIDFVSSGKDTSKSLTITGDCNADANVITYVSGNSANLVKAEGAGSGILTISAVGSADEIFSITYDATDTNGTNVKVAEGVNKAIGGTSDIEGEIIQITLTEGATGDWYIGSAISKGVDTSVQEVASSALAVNYDLYLANFNSLNKRMGELRNTQESNGVWARVFGGAMSNDFGVGSKTDYITTQAGYDYSLSVGENARNFIGVALAYGASSTKSNPSSNPNTGVLDNISSSMVEVGVYNSYVADSGWYNDTIFKFDYIMSDFTLKTGANSQQNSTSNFAMILSDEFGYRYSFGENEKGSWYIDPQVEVAFGYFNQSDFNQALNEGGTRTIKATQDSILTLRSRIGASLGKKFNTEKGFASLYVGAFYEYDYIEGGKSDYSLISSGQEVSNPLQSLESNGRAILNVGSNIELTKGARLYIDVEKSFGDKQRTFMQFNLGARYSF